MFSERPGFGCHEAGQGLVQKSDELHEPGIPFFKTIIDFRTALPVHEQYVILFSEYQPRDRTKPAPRLAVCWILSFASPV